MTWEMHKRIGKYKPENDSPFIRDSFVAELPNGGMAHVVTIADLISKMEEAWRECPCQKTKPSSSKEWIERWFTVPPSNGVEIRGRSK